jgi:Flp pilus assembly protein TadG
MAVRSLRGTRGFTIVEFALVLPLFLILLAAIIDFGILFFVQHTLQFATREGARLALVGRTVNDASGNPMSREASIVQTIKVNAAIAVNPSQLQISFYPINADYSDPAGWQGRQDAGAPGKYMRVKTRYDFPVPLVSTFVPQVQLTLTAQSTYRNERFN